MDEPFLQLLSLLQAEAVQKQQQQASPKFSAQSSMARPARYRIFPGLVRAHGAPSFAAHTESLLLILRAGTEHGGRARTPSEQFFSLCTSLSEVTPQSQPELISVTAVEFPTDFGTVFFFSLTPQFYPAPLLACRCRLVDCAAGTLSLTRRSSVGDSNIPSIARATPICGGSLSCPRDNHKRHFFGHEQRR